jgi:hypothetical protein
VDVQKDSILRMTRFGFYISLFVKVMPKLRELSRVYRIHTNEEK